MATCTTCKRKIKRLQDLSDDESMDEMGRICPRCRALFCINCIQKWPPHQDHNAKKCGNCGKYTVIEAYGPVTDSMLEGIGRRLMEKYG
jgi:hypothetical protein